MSLSNSPNKLGRLSPQRVDTAQLKFETFFFFKSLLQIPTKDESNADNLPE